MNGCCVHLCIDFWWITDLLLPCQSDATLSSSSHTMSSFLRTARRVWVSVTFQRQWKFGDKLGRSRSAATAWKAQWFVLFSFFLFHQDALFSSEEIKKGTYKNCTVTKCQHFTTDQVANAIYNSHSLTSRKCCQGKSLRHNYSLKHRFVNYQAKPLFFQPCKPRLTTGHLPTLSEGSSATFQDIAFKRECKIVL